MGGVAARRAAKLLVIAIAAVAAGCGDDPEPLSFACTSGADAVERALAEAPGAVTLEGGVPLSACIRNARSDGDLQNVGAVLTGAAEHLEERAAADPTAALQLGYLVGAARRGARRNGLGTEIARRLEAETSDLGSDRAAYRRGLRAGLAQG